MFLPARVQLMVIPTQNSSMLTHILAASLGPFQKMNSLTTIPNPGPARKLLSLSIPGTYKLLQSGIQLQESTRTTRTLPGSKNDWVEGSPGNKECRTALKKANDPIRNARHAVMLRIGRCNKLPVMLNHRYCTFTVLEAGNTSDSQEHEMV
eukprot:1151010-Pelagomonas_calceolata.AAC.1